MIDIPDFTTLSDDDLHGWEFTVYDRVPGEAELHEIIGPFRARAYYSERGKRIDAAALVAINEEMALLVEHRLEIVRRLREGTSGQHHFSSQTAGWS